MIRSCLSRSRLLLLATGLLMACAPARPPLLLDLTHSFGEETIYWPTNKPFHWEKTDWGTTAAGYWYASANFSASEHGGTHMDAPIHFGRGRSTLDQVPVERLIGPAVVIDARPQCQTNPDYELTVDDLQGWESRHGRIEDGALVLMLTGWGQRWPDKTSYLGSAADDPQLTRQALTPAAPGISRLTKFSTAPMFMRWRTWPRWTDSRPEAPRSLPCRSRSKEERGDRSASSL